MTIKYSIKYKITAIIIIIVVISLITAAVLSYKLFANLMLKTYINNVNSTNKYITSLIDKYIKLNTSWDSNINDSIENDKTWNIGLILSTMIKNANINYIGIIHNGIIYRSTDVDEWGKKIKLKTGLIGNTYYSVFLSNYDYVLYVHYNFSDIKETLNYLIAIIILITIIGVVLGSILGIYFGNKFAERIIKLSEASNEFAAGNFSHRPVKDESKDEIGVMSKSLYKIMEVADRHIKEFTTGTEIQNILIPKSVPVINGYDADIFYKPYGEMSGDYVDMLKIDEKRYLFFIGDVEGKGLASAMVMAIMKSALSTCITHNIIEPDLVLYNLALVHHSILHVKRTKIKSIKDIKYQPKKYVVCCCLLLDVEKNIIKIAHAFDERIIFYSNKENAFKDFALPQVSPIGLEKDLNLYRADPISIKFEEGDILFLATDGVSEARKTAINKKIDFYGFPEYRKIKNIISRNKNLSCVNIRKAIIEDMRISNYKISDDITSIMIKKKIK